VRLIPWHGLARETCRRPFPTSFPDWSGALPATEWIVPVTASAPTLASTGVTFASPKSRILAWPRSVTKILAGFMCVGLCEFGWASTGVRQFLVASPGCGSGDDSQPSRVSNRKRSSDSSERTCASGSSIRARVSRDSKNSTSSACRAASSACRVASSCRANSCWIAPSLLPASSFFVLLFLLCLALLNCNPQGALCHPPRGTAAGRHSWFAEYGAKLRGISISLILIWRRRASVRRPEKRPDP
jgi:hypothetical protein